jgi:hypothetical protein
MFITAKIANTLLKRHLKGTTPLTVEEDQQSNFFKTLETYSKQHQTLQSWKIDSNQNNIHENYQEGLRFTYNYGDAYYNEETVKLKFRDQQLSISFDYRSHAYIYQLEQFYSLLEGLKQAIDTEVGEKLKKKKIKALKYQAINGKIKTLAKAEKFDYYLQEYQTKIKLHVRLDQRILEVDIHNHKFQTVLQELQNFIRSFRSLHQSGISFRFKTVKSQRHRWVRHEEL